MKIKITEIEASADELRQSNTLSEGLSNMLRNIFNPLRYNSVPEECDDEEVGSDI